MTTKRELPRVKQAAQIGLFIADVSPDVVGARASDLHRRQLRSGRLDRGRLRRPELPGCSVARGHRPLTAAVRVPRLAHPSRTSRAPELWHQIGVPRGRTARGRRVLRSFKNSRLKESRSYPGIELRPVGSWRQWEYRGDFRLACPGALFIRRRRMPCRRPGSDRNLSASPAATCSGSPAKSRRVVAHAIASRINERRRAPTGTSGLGPTSVITEPTFSKAALSARPAEDHFPRGSTPQCGLNRANRASKNDCDNPFGATAALVVAGSEDRKDIPFGDFPRSSSVVAGWFARSSPGSQRLELRTASD